ncbi:glycosyltransferase [uncultured Tenacibaculum sp.]|uniref:glycosyltransferase family 2 protein n=1 Tax=uncultured Tenacibaculum sp. TaxID=174713 RepID=UPI002636DF6D|nr:glycosyltransferase [uncultured Tenacibaculum sp.]
MKRLIIIIPCYNEAAHIKTVLNQIINSFPLHPSINFELFILDDCSTDNSYEILQKFKNKYSFIHLMHHKENKGIVEATKNLISAALKQKPDYLLKCDMDTDFSHPIILKKFLPYINKHITNHSFLIGIRKLNENSNCSDFEIVEKNKMNSYLVNELNIKNYEPISSGVQLYDAFLIQKLLNNQLVIDFNERWGLDILLPVLATLLGYSTTQIFIAQGSYQIERRSKEKIEKQYQIYYRIFKLLEKRKKNRY